MAETTQTNSTGGLLSGLRDVLVSAIPAAADVLKTRYTTPAPPPAPSVPPAATGSPAPSWYQPWMGYAAGGVAVLALVALLFRRGR